MSLFSTFQFAKLIVPYLSSDENAVSRHDGHYYKEMDRAAAGLERHLCPAGDLLRRQDARVTESLARHGVDPVPGPGVPGFLHCSWRIDRVPAQGKYRSADPWQ